MTGYFMLIRKVMIYSGTLNMVDTPLAHLKEADLRPDAGFLAKVLVFA